MGHFWQCKIWIHFNIDSNTASQILWVALGVRHLRSAIYRAAVRPQLFVMNNTRGVLAVWAVARWYQHEQDATKGGLAHCLQGRGWEVADLTRHLLL